MTEKLYLKKVCIDYNPFDKNQRLAIIPYVDEEINTLEKDLWIELMVGSSPLYVHFRNITYCNNEAIYEAASYSTHCPNDRVYAVSTVG